jgi:hypothetical protein
MAATASKLCFDTESPHSNWQAVMLLRMVQIKQTLPFVWIMFFASQDNVELAFLPKMEHCKGRVIEKRARLETPAICDCTLWSIVITFCCWDRNL